MNMTGVSKAIVAERKLSLQLLSITRNEQDTINQCGAPSDCFLLAVLFWEMNNRLILVK